MAEVDWTEPALRDLEIVINYIAMDSPRYAERCGNNIVQAPRILKDHPKIGRIIPEFNVDSVRELIYGAYRIIYEIRKDTCYIVAVIHSSRDLIRHYKPGKWDIT